MVDTAVLERLETLVSPFGLVADVQVLRTPRGVGEITSCMAFSDFLQPGGMRDSCDVRQRSRSDRLKPGSSGQGLALGDAGEARLIAIAEAAERYSAGDFQQPVVWAACFATTTKGGQLADLELLHRRRGSCEDRIRRAKDTSLRNLPLHGFAANQILVPDTGARSSLWPANCSPGPRCSPHRRRPPIGTRAAATEDLHLRWAHRPQRRSAEATPRRQLAMGQEITTAITHLQALAPG